MEIIKDGEFRGTTRDGEAAMREYGFDPVRLDKIGAPTPGRVADRLSDLVGSLEDAIKDGNRATAMKQVRGLNRLRLALDAWDFCMVYQGVRWDTASAPAGSRGDGRGPADAPGANGTAAGAGLIAFRALNDDIPDEWEPGVHWQIEFYPDDCEVGAPLGLAWVSVYPTFTFLDFVLVRDDERRRGIATALVAACRVRWPELQGLDPEDAVSEAGEAFLKSLGIAIPPSGPTPVGPTEARPEDPLLGGSRA